MVAQTHRAAHTLKRNGVACCEELPGPQAGDAPRVTALLSGHLPCGRDLHRSIEQAEELGRRVARNPVVIEECALKGVSATAPDAAAIPGPAATSGAVASLGAAAISDAAATLGAAAALDAAAALGFATPPGAAAGLDTGAASDRGDATGTADAPTAPASSERKGASSVVPLA